jgi:hypothetical protein
MNFARPIEYLREHLKALKWILYGLLALAIVYDLLVPRHEIHFFGDKFRGFWAAFGLVGCILLIKIMKGIAHTVLMKREDYYD